ncbi:unnamed protein product [Closterium sp. Naga37s-1]|nr:unnamed protein product [Closterium sp. Naga37s-1]
MARQAPPRGTRRVPRLLLLLLLLLRDQPLLLLLSLIVSVSATVTVAVAVAQDHDTFAAVTYLPATQSLALGPGYTVSVNPATNPPSLAVVDWNGAPVAPTYNADGSATVAGYTAYPNGTVIGPGGLSIYLQGSSSDPLFSMGTTTVLRNGTIVDGSGKKLVPTKNPKGDGSYTAGDLTGWPRNGLIIGSGGAVINAGVPLTLTADGSIAFAPHVAVPVPGAAISANPATHSLSFGYYTLCLNGTEMSLLDSSRNPVQPTTNPDGSRYLGGYTLYKNGTITAPGGIAIDTVGPNAGLRVGRTTVLIVNGTVLDGSGAKIMPTGPNEDGSYSAGDVKGWANGTIIDTNTGVVLYAGAPLALTADGRVTLASLSIPTGAAAPSAAAAAPPTDAASPPPDAGAPTADAAAPSADAASTSPPAASTSPPAASTSPPAASTSPPAASTSPPAASTSPPAGASTPAAAPPPPKTAAFVFHTRHMAVHTRHMAGHTRHMAGHTRHMAGHTRHMEGHTRHMAGHTQHMAVTPGTWRVTPSTWWVTPGTWWATPGTWRVTPSTWRSHPAHGGEGHARHCAGALLLACDMMLASSATTPLHPCSFSTSTPPRPC